MNTARWDAAAARTLDAAASLLSTAELRWVDRPAWTGDPSLLFDRLLRATLATGAGNKAEAAASDSIPMPAAATRPARGWQAARPAASALDARPWPWMETSAPVASTSASRTQATRDTAEQLPARSVQPALATTQPVVSRAARVAALSTQRSTGTASRGPATFEPIRAQLAWPTAHVAEPVAMRSRSEALEPDLGAAAARNPVIPFGARVLRLLDTPSPAAPSDQTDRPRPALRPVEPPWPTQAAGIDQQAARAELPRSTRLVEGLPALQGLLQAALVQSQERQWQQRPSGSESTHAVARLADVDPASLTAAPALRVLPQLDAVTEDMLVDRLTDRLQERLREQALRQFGFTGGLT